MVVDFKRKIIFMNADTCVLEHFVLIKILFQKLEEIFSVKVTLVNQLYRFRTTGNCQVVFRKNWDEISEEFFSFFVNRLPYAVELPVVY